MKTSFRIVLLLLVITVFSKTVFAQSNPFIDNSKPVCAYSEYNLAQSQENPEFAKALQDFRDAIPFLSETLEKSDSFPPLISIPIVIHIIHNGEPVGTGQNLSEERILAQLEILNQDFQSLNANYYNTPAQWSDVIGVPNIQFCLADTDPDGNATTGIDRVEMTVTGTTWQSNNINSEIKPALSWDSDNYYNVYVLPIPGTDANGGVVGFANNPTTFTIGTTTDGAVADYRWFGGPGFGSSGHRTLTHETGHYLGLDHPFEGNSCNQDDGIADTPNVSDATSTLVTITCDDEYPAGPESCGNDHMYINFMDYVDESCYTSFTHGQSNVMRAVLNGTAGMYGWGSREDLATNAAIACNLVEDDAGITRILSPSERECENDPFEPIVALRNFGVNDLNSAYIIYQINEEDPDSLLWQGTLYPGEEIEVNLGGFLPNTVQYDFRAYTAFPNEMLDLRNDNDTTSQIGAFFFIPVEPPVFEDFENETSFPTADGFFPLNIDGDDFSFELSDEASGFGIGSTSIVFDNYTGTASNNPFGTFDAFITPHFDLSESTDIDLFFDVAYAEFTNLISDTLFILAATDCSPVFDILIYFKGGSDLATAAPNANPFTPASTEWRKETVDLSQFEGLSDVTFAFLNFSGWGNRLFIDNIQIGLPCVMDLTATSDAVSCHADCDGTATVTANGGTGSLTYLWDVNANSQTTATANNLCPGNYSVTVTDELGCSNALQVTIEEPLELSISAAATHETANNSNDGTASALGNGGTGDIDYLWNTGSMDQLITGLMPGTYTVTITDENDCVAITSVVVEAFECPGFNIASPVTNVSCFGEMDGNVLAIPLGANGPFQYLWSDGQITQLADNLVAGEYTVTVTDGFDCTVTKTATVFQPDELLPNISSTPETTNGANDGTASVNPDGGTPLYDVMWSTGSSDLTITNLSPGTYTVTITDGSLCETTGTVTVSSFDCGAFSANISNTDISCNGASDGTASTNLIGGSTPITYMWSNDATTPNIQDLSPGEYTVTISDGNNCDIILQTNISEPNLLSNNLNVFNETGNDANDGSASTNVSGGTMPYDYMWSGGGSGDSVENLPPGEYTVTIIDAHDCEIVESFTIEEFVCAMNLATFSENASCPSAMDGSAGISELIGATEPIDYLWSNDQTTPTISNIGAGIYGLTITDVNNCSINTSVEIFDIDDTPPIAQANNITLELDENGLGNITSAMVNNGSSDNCEIVEMNLSQETFDCSSVGSNEITFTVIDDTGLETSIPVTITVVDNINPTITCPENIVLFSCESELNYDLPIVEDNCEDLDLQLMNGIGSGGTFPIGTTVETYQVSDLAGNTATCSFNITIDFDLFADYEIHEPSCFGFSNGWAAVSVLGGTPPYLIDFPGGDPVDLSAGTYAITITDNNNCAIIDSFEITEPSLLEISVDGTIAAVNGENGAAQITITGGTPPYNVQWVLSGDIISTEEDPNDLIPGTYTLIIADANNCGVGNQEVLIDNMVGINELELDNAIQLYPNPTGGKVLVEIELQEQKEIVISILDVTGKMLQNNLQFNTAAASFPIDLNEFSNGIYFVRFLVGEEILTKRVVLIKN